MNRKRGAALILTIIIIIVLMILLMAFVFIKTGQYSRIDETTNTQIEENLNNNDDNTNINTEVNIYEETQLTDSDGKTLGELINSAESYGKTINYQANGITNWKIFYHTDEYVYLIASEKISETNIPKLLKTKSGASLKSQTITFEDGSSKEVGQIFWVEGNVPTKAAKIQNPELWMARWPDYNTDVNARCASYFLDETIWESLKNTTASYKEYVVGAIGTPTAEMYVESWNAKREIAVAKGDTKTYHSKLILVEMGSGYCVMNMTNGKVNGEYPMAYEVRTTDTLLFWSRADYSSIWLASPSRWGNDTIMNVNNGVGVSSYDCYVENYGVRPVVCLNADIPATIGNESTTDFVI